MNFSFDPLALSAMILFGIIGTLVLWHEKRNHWNPLRILIGIALCVFPYFITTTWLLCIVGAALCGGLFIDYE